LKKRKEKKRKQVQNFLYLFLEHSTIFPSLKIIGIQNSDEFSFTTEANEAKAAKPQELKKSKTQDKLLAENKKTAESIFFFLKKNHEENEI